MLSLPKDIHNAILNKAIPIYTSGSEENFSPGRVFDFKEPRGASSMGNEIRQGWLETDYLEYECTLFYLVVQIELIQAKCDNPSLFKKQMEYLLQIIDKNVIVLPDDMRSLPQVAMAWKDIRFSTCEELRKSKDDQCWITEQTWKEILQKLRID